MVCGMVLTKFLILMNRATPGQPCVYCDEVGSRGEICTVPTACNSSVSSQSTLATIGHNYNITSGACFSKVA